MGETKVLLVDDDGDLLRLLSRQLTRDGYRLSHARDGFSAFRMARKEQPDVMVLDLGLPAGDGFQVMERMQRNTETFHIPIVVLTGRAHELEARSLEAGASAFLRKPVEIAQLRETLCKVLDGFAD